MKDITLVDFLTIFSVITSILGVIVSIASIIGWFMTINNFLTKCDFEESYKAEMIRGAGVIGAPFGGVLGWAEFFEIYELGDEIYIAKQKKLDEEFEAEERRLRGEE